MPVISGCQFKMKHKTFKATALSAGIAMALGTAPPTFAPDDQIEEIVVTGPNTRLCEYASP